MNYYAIHIHFIEIRIAFCSNDKDDNYGKSNLQQASEIYIVFFVA